MRISVFASTVNPVVDPPLLRKSQSHCRAEVEAGRARMIDVEDIRRGIQLLPTTRAQGAEIRGSHERRGPLTAGEARLNAEHRGPTEESVARLAQRYEAVLERHILAGRRGVPYAGNVIAARVKTLLSAPKPVSD